MSNDLEFETRLLALKKAAIGMNTLADIQSASVKQETKTLAWAISWAVTELATYKAKEESEGA